MESGQPPEIFEGLQFYMQSVGVDLARRAKLVQELQTRGAVQILRPDDLTCKAIFVFSQKPLRRFKSPNKAKPIETCRQSNTWTFHDLCTHFGRVPGDKLKNKQYVVDYTWIDESIELGRCQYSNRWHQKEIMLNSQILKIQITTLPSATPVTPKTPLAQPENQARPTTKGRKRAATLSSADQPATKINRSGTPHQSRASAPTAFEIESLLATCTPSVTAALAPLPRYFALGGSFRKPTPAEKLVKNRCEKARQEVLLAHIVGELDGWCKAGSPGSRSAFLEEAQTSSESDFNRLSFFTIHKEAISTALAEKGCDVRLGTKVYGRPAKGKWHAPSDDSIDQAPQGDDLSGSSAFSDFSQSLDPAAPNEAKSSGSSRSIATRPRSASVANVSSGARFFGTPNALTKASLKISAPAQQTQKLATGDHEAGHSHLSLGLRQIVGELDEWCGRGSPGSRTAYLKGINRAKPGHDRVSSFKRHRKEILGALSDLGRDVSEGSKLNGAGLGVTRLVAAEKSQDRLDKLIIELSVWCRDGSRGSRGAFLREPTEATNGVDRNSLFRRNRDYILERLSEMAIDVSEGTKIFGNPMTGPRPLSFPREYRQTSESKDPRARASSFSGLSPHGSTCPSTSARFASSSVNPKPTASSSSSSNTLARSPPTVARVSAAPTSTEACAAVYDHSTPFPLDWASTTRFD